MRTLYYIPVILFFVILSNDINVKAETEETPALSDFVICVHQNSRQVNLREGECKSKEFEVKVDDTGTSEPVSECPCFNEHRLRNTLFTLFPLPSIPLCFLEESNEDGSILALLFENSLGEPILDTRYAEVGDIFAGNGKLCGFAPNFGSTENEFFKLLSLIRAVDAAEASACESLIQEWINDESIPECEGI